jgi:hypothetical protein
MKMINKVFLWIHILPWAIFTGGVFWDILVNGRSFMPNIYLGVLLSGLYIFYLHFFILTRYLDTKRYIHYFLRLIPILVTGAIPFLLFLDQADAHERSEGLSMALGVIFAFMTLSFLVWLAKHFVIRAIVKEQREKQSISTELAYLKSQINPHFLFNTLNNIHTLVYTKAPEAPGAMMQLSSLMRYMLYESNASTVPLTIELQYLRDYIALQQLRYQANDIVDFRVEGDVDQYYIAPLLFIHLLENAYKHSPATLDTGSIQVIVSVDDKGLQFSCENPIGKKAGHALEEPPGIGLANVRKRLQLIYPEKHDLQVTPTDTQFNVLLRILVKQSNERKAELLYH